MVANKVKQILEEALPGSQVFIKDFTGGGDHLEANIVWDGFEGLSRVQQQRKVFEIIGDMIGDGKPVHALSMKTWSSLPEELDNPSQAYLS